MIFSAPEPWLECTIVITFCPSLTFNIFDFSKTAEQISTKLDRNQDINVLYKVCVFRANWLNHRAALASDWLRHFYFSETAERNSTQLDRRQDRNVLYEFCVFRADRKNKMATSASDWLRNEVHEMWPLVFNTDCIHWC